MENIGVRKSPLHEQEVVARIALVNGDITPQLGS